MKVKNLFLFGAGASHGCKGLNEVVPLGNNLFMNLRNKFPKTWGILPISLESYFKNNFEQGMGKLWNDPIFNIKIPLLMKDMAVYFSRFQIINYKHNFYYQLFNKIKNIGLLKETTLSTINYDCLMELTLEKLNIKYSYLNSEIPGKIAFLKIHGSCNFILDDTIKAQSSVEYRPGVIFNPPLIYISPDKVETYCYSSTALYPAMAIYMKGKPIQMGYSDIKRMQKNWQTKIEKAEKVFIIGVNPNLEDDHIWDYIHKKDRVFFCGCKISFDKWQKNEDRKDIFLNCTFESSIEIIIKYSSS